MSKLFLNNLPMSNFFTMCSYIIKLFLILSQYITSTFLYVNFIRSPCLNYFLNNLGSDWTFSSTRFWQNYFLIKVISELFLEQGSDGTISWTRPSLWTIDQNYYYFLIKVLSELFLKQVCVWNTLCFLNTISQKTSTSLMSGTRYISWTCTCSNFVFNWSSCLYHNVFLEHLTFSNVQTSHVVCHLFSMCMVQPKFVVCSNTLFPWWPG